MPPHALLSSARQDWRTPAWFLDLVRDVGQIGLDPASAEENPTGARLYAAPDGPFPWPGWVASEGLTLPWRPLLRAGELAFVNPPYGAHLSGVVDPEAEIKRGGTAIGRGTGWAEKIAREADQGASILALVPVRTETRWWRRLFHASDFCLFWSSAEHGCRISFVDPDTGIAAPGSNLASCVFYSGPEDGRERFASVFGRHGTLVAPRGAEGFGR